jgi:hypothetical protein
VRQLACGLGRHTVVTTTAMLKQDDFRKLLAKGKDTAKDGKDDGKGKAGAGGSKADAQKKKEKRKRSYQEFLKKKEQRKAEDAPKYRDRAAERRQGKLLDYADTESALQNVSVEHSKAGSGAYVPVLCVRTHCVRVHPCVCVCVCVCACVCVVCACGPHVFS